MTASVGSPSVGSSSSPIAGSSTALSMPASMAERAYTGLRDDIVTLRLEPGAALVEEALIERLAVGRTPLREALKRLETERLVTIYPRRGTFVAEVNLTDHSLISDVRRQLEGLAAERAAVRATPLDRADLRDLIEAIDRHPGGRTAGMELDTRIHRAIHRAARNPYLEANLSNYYNLSLRIWYLFLDRLPEVDHRAEHRPMLEAAVAGEAALAGRLAREHVDHFEQSVRAVL
jgi:DNA-binding GntR family transcriptional regulator